MPQFDAQSAARIAKVVRNAERTAGASTPLPTINAGLSSYFWIKLGTEDPNNPGRYQWTKQDWNVTISGIGFKDSTLGGTSDTTNYSARDANKTSGLKGVIVEARFYGYDTNSPPNPVYLFGSAQSSPFIPVYVQVDGGSAGGTGGTCSYTYTVTNLDGSAIPDASGNASTTKQTPTWNAASFRLSGVYYGPPGAADPCLALRLASGGIQLLFVTESPTDAQCSTNGTSGGS